MAYISKYDITTTTFMNKKYKNFNVNFRNYDDYLIWLYYTFSKKNDIKYYNQLEDDFIEYSKWQIENLNFCQKVQE
ncbi:MAG: hypothetical protein IJN13_00355 [Bacilli bacterium]|nr:hypothetical protein [Bacilli bacterium]